MFQCPAHQWYSDVSPCPACARTVTTGGDLPFEFQKFPGPKGSALIKENDTEELIRLLKMAEYKGDIPEYVLKGFDVWAIKNRLKFTVEERNTAAVVFMAGMAFQSALNQKEAK